MNTNVLNKINKKSSKGIIRNDVDDFWNDCINSEPVSFSNSIGNSKKEIIKNKETPTEQYITCKNFDLIFISK